MPVARRSLALATPGEHGVCRIASGDHVEAVGMLSCGRSRPPSVGGQVAGVTTSNSCRFRQQSVRGSRKGPPGISAHLASSELVAEAAEAVNRLLGRVGAVR
jgi:hypothetical protein